MPPQCAERRAGRVEQDGASGPKRRPPAVRDEQRELEQARERSDEDAGRADHLVAEATALREEAAAHDRTLRDEIGSLEGRQASSQEEVARLEEQITAWVKDLRARPRALILPVAR